MRWLVEPGAAVPAEVRGRLLNELFSGQGAIIMGAINGLIINVVALCIHGGAVFAVLLLLELGCGAFRLVVLRYVAQARASGKAPALDLAVTMSILWCALQGMMAFAAMQTGDGVLQTLSATMVLGAVGPICARNYPAPRLAFLLILLCDLPFVTGGCASGQFWLMILIPLTPPFLFGARQVVGNFQRLAVTSLIAELDSRNRAYHDSLTGLLNRRAFTEAMADPLLGQNEPFALLCLDLDGFKNVNDTLGHHAGDCLLAGVAVRLRESVRPGDHVFRLGGDEFVIMLYGMPPDAVGRFAERIIGDVSQNSYLFADLMPMRIGVSLGFASYPEDGVEPVELHRRADVALYDAKAAGKGVYKRVRSPDAAEGWENRAGLLPSFASQPGSVTLAVPSVGDG